MQLEADNLLKGVFSMFSEWLEETKNFTVKAAMDATSRLKRVQRLIDSEKIESDVVSKLENNDEFKSLSVTVKSQLRRTARLYLEYLQK